MGRSSEDLMSIIPVETTIYLRLAWSGMMGDCRIRCERSFHIELTDLYKVGILQELILHGCSWVNREISKRALADFQTWNYEDLCKFLERLPKRICY